MVDLMPSIREILLNKCESSLIPLKSVARMINTEETNLLPSLKFLYDNQISYDFLVNFLFDYLTGKEDKFSRLNKMLSEKGCPYRVNLDRSIIELNLVNLTDSSPYKLVKKFIKYGFLSFNIYGMPNERDYDFINKLNSEHPSHKFRQVCSDDSITDFHLNFEFDWIEYSDFLNSHNWLMMINENKEEVRDYVQHLVNKNYFFYYYNSSSLTCSSSNILKLDVGKVVI